MGIPVIEANSNLANVERLLTAAERQHVDRLRDIEQLDRKIGIVLAAQSAILTKGAELRWLPDHTMFGIIWAAMGVVTLACAGFGFFTRGWRETPNTGRFREKYLDLTRFDFLDQLLANYAAAIEENTRSIGIKGRSLNFALVTLFVTILMLVVEKGLEGGPL